MTPKKIILISLDTLRADHLGCYGYPRNTSPILDSLASQAILFKNACSPSSFTIPAHASIFTGKNPSHHSIGFKQGLGKLDKDLDITLAEYLKYKSFKTTAFVSSLVLRRETNLDSGFDHYDDTMTSQELNRPEELLRDGSETCDRTLEWIRENNDKNFFVFLHLFDIHGPYVCKEPFQSMFINDKDSQPSKNLTLIVPDNNPVRGIPSYQVLKKTLDEEGNIVSFETSVQYYISQYDGNIRYCDSVIGNLISVLKDLRIFDDVMLIITSDHGEAFGENDIYFYHGLTVTREQIHVPLIIKPHKEWAVKSGVLDVPVSTVDILPTLLDLCNHPFDNSEIEGQSLRKVIEGQNDPVFHNRVILSENEQQYALIYPNRVMELFNKEPPSDSFYPYLPELINSLNGKKYCWSSGTDYLFALPFDQYQRNKTISDIINKFRKKDEPFKILVADNGVEGSLEKFLQHDIVHTLKTDLTGKNSEKGIIGVGDLLKEESHDIFDFIVAVDVFEGIPEADRKRFLDNLISSSTIATIIASPFDQEYIKNSNFFTTDVYKIPPGSEYSWLKNRVANGLPDLSSTIDLVKDHQVNPVIIPNGYLPRWTRMISTSLQAEGKQEFSQLKITLDEFYNMNCCQSDNRNPAFRQVIVIPKAELSIDYSDLISKTTDHQNINDKNQLLESFIEKINRLYQVNEKIQKQISREQVFDQQIRSLEQTLRTKDIQIQTLITKVNVLRDENSGLYDSISYKCTSMFDRVFIERLMPPDTRRRRYYHLGIRGGRILVNEGWRSFWRQFQERRSNKPSLLTKVTIPPLNFSSLKKTDITGTIDTRVSILIPTKNAGPDFERVLEKIDRQKGIRDIQILVVDSGSTDDTLTTAKKFKAQILSVQPEDSDYGIMLDLLDQNPRGEYVCFLIQDAIPIGDYWLHTMITSQITDPGTAAAACRRIPRSDADLFACFLAYEHHKHSMQFYSCSTPACMEKNAGPMDIVKRWFATPEEVTWLIRTDLFEKNRIQKTLSSEKLDLMPWLLQGRQKVIYVSSAGVIQSVNRDASDLFRHTYTNGKRVAQISGFDPEKSTFDSGLPDVIDSIIQINNALKKAIQKMDELPPVRVPHSQIEKIKTDTHHFLEYDVKTGSKCREGPLDNILSSLFAKISFHSLDQGKNSHVPILYNQYIAGLEEYDKYLSVYDSIDDKQDQFISSLFMLLAHVAGNNLAGYYAFKSIKNERSEEISSIDTILSERV